MSKRGRGRTTPKSVRPPQTPTTTDLASTEFFLTSHPPLIKDAHLTKIGLPIGTGVAGGISGLEALLYQTQQD
jgi:hypothetical protein